MPVMKTNDANNTYANRNRIDAARRVTSDLRAHYGLRRLIPESKATAPKAQNEQMAIPTC
ncbi:MAG: hypothetical protein JSS82_07655 [Bacteroidetes bacterium]|nr:hypothetical protein [Bacteroidota bacterium]